MTIEVDLDNVYARKYPENFNNFGFVLCLPRYTLIFPALVMRNDNDDDHSNALRAREYHDAGMYNVAVSTVHDCSE